VETTVTNIVYYSDFDLASRQAIVYL